ncbi:MAG: GspH/FimT family pseudopilin [Hyphomicrobium sp.]
MRSEGLTQHENDEGFTLLEMLVVLLISALVVSTALIARGGSSASLRVLGVRLAAELNSARAAAIAKDQPVDVIVDRSGRSYRAGASKGVILQGGVRLRFEPAHTLAREETSRRLVFFSDGSSTGGLFKLAELGRVFAVRVDWMSGAVTLEGGAR